MLPFLPPEIILNIIRLSLPPATYNGYRERYDLLLAFSLVDRTWRSLAQGELFESVVLDDSYGEERLSDALNSTAAGFASEIKTLRLAAGPGGDDLSRATRAVRVNLWTLCSATIEVRASVLRLRLSDLAAIKSLRRLHLYVVNVLDLPSDFPSPVAPLFSHLEHLSLDEFGAYNPAEWMYLVCPSVFPALRSLLLARTMDYPIPRNTPTMLESVGSQVTTLAVIDESSEQKLLQAMAPCWRFFTALKHLVILGRGFLSHRNTLQDPYALIPSSLHSLEIILTLFAPVEPEYTIRHLLFSLRSDITSLRAIKRISIPPPDSIYSFLPSNTHGSTLGAAPTPDRGQLKSLAEARQIVLDETGLHPDRASAVWSSAWEEFSRET